MLLERLLSNAGRGDAVGLLALAAYLVKRSACTPTFVQDARAMHLFASYGRNEHCLRQLFGLCGEASLSRTDPVLRREVYQAISTPLGDNDRQEFSPYLHEIACGFLCGKYGYPLNGMIAVELLNILAQKADEPGDAALRALFEVCGSLTEDADPRARRAVYAVIINPPRPTAERLAALINSGVNGMIVSRAAAVIV